MARMIKYKAKCYKCGNWFEKGKAFLHRVRGQWLCHCLECYRGEK